MARDSYEISLWDDIHVDASLHTYKWYVNKNDGDGWQVVNTAKYPTGKESTLAAAAGDWNGYKYRCVVTYNEQQEGEPSSATSSYATLTVVKPPSDPDSDVNPLQNMIISTSGNVNAKVGDIANFSIEVGSSNVTSYVWQVSKDNGSTWSNVNATKYPSSRTPNLSFQVRNGMNNYRYHCKVTFANGDDPIVVTSANKKLTISSYTNRIVQQPNDVVVVEGDFFRIGVTTSGEKPSYFDEEKIAIIGSDTMTSNCRAYDPHLVENINGTHTFTFKMYMKYTEKGAEETKLDNPFLALLVNERKVKVHWKDEWYDLVIKKIQENSTDKSITYTCSDVFINELSKNGFNLEFATELENNQGTAIELGKKVLENTDWQLDEENSDIIQQEKEEPVYEVTTTAGINGAANDTQGTTENIASGSQILVFYSQIQDLATKIGAGTTSGTIDLQFAYSESYVKDYNSQLVVNADSYSINGAAWAKKVDSETGVNYIKFSFGKIYYEGGVSDNYRAKRLVKSQKSILDPLTGYYVSIFKADGDDTKTPSRYSNGDTIYRYQSTLYKDPTIVNNILVNSSNFDSTSGWLRYGAGDTNALRFQMYPLYNGENLDTFTSNGYLIVPATTGSKYVYNAGLRESSSYTPNGYQYGETYILRYKAYRDTTVDGVHQPESALTLNLSFKICNFEYDDETGVPVPIPENQIVDENHNVGYQQYFSIGGGKTADGWREHRATCIRSVDRNGIYREKVGFFLQCTASDGVWIKDIQFFPEVFDANGDRINPGEMDKQSIAQPYYYYYNHTKNIGLTNPDELKYIAVVTEPLTDSAIKPVYNDNFTKIRSIEIKESNRFNILQTIAETFECWVRFRINHDENTGKTEIIDGVPQKFVTLKKEIGEDLGIGFVYGIDLKGIQRDIQSDQIVTKTIVLPNSNEFAQNGFCTIARSPENYPRVNYILNLDYYITHGLLDGAELNKDLYLSTGDLGYFYNLHRLNTQYDALTELIGAKRLELAKQESYKTLYEDYITSLAEQITRLESEIIALASAEKNSITTYKQATSFAKKHTDYTELITRINAHENAKNSLKVYNDALTSLDSSIATLSEALDELDLTQEQIVEEVEDLDLRFYKKYSRFLQEGTWTNENYIDDTLYYLDAQSVAYTASRPQVSYNISVIRVSALPEFENKVFHCGDIAFVQDTDFFGYVFPNGIKTPYKEKVLVSEIHSYFDSPDKDTFVVQNYRTQFEDLFQRITAATQSLQYASGSYARAAAVVETTGTLKTEVLQNSIARNEQLVYKANNESIIQDSTGITVTNLSNPNEKTKVTSGGIFITTDGGASWKNAVRGEGIATQYLTSGSVNTNQISLYDGNYPTFKWDSSGINAYAKENYGEDSTADSGPNLGKFVRFDQYGVYGIDNSGSKYTPEDENQIWNDAKFGLTWKGLFVKNRYGDHYVEVSSENDIQVVEVKTSANVDRVKIGKLGNGQYTEFTGEEFTSGITYYVTDGAGNYIRTYDKTKKSGKTYYVYQNGVYGMRLKDSTGAVTLETSSNGTLWLRDSLYIGTSTDSYNVSLGHLSGVKEQDNTIHEVINASSNFIVYEDGSVRATDGYFSGEINATSGTFTGTINATGGNISGNFTIDDILYLGTYEEKYLAQIGRIEKFLDPPYILFTGESFEDGITYYEYNNETDTYFETSDETLDESKQYYTYELINQVINVNDAFVVYANGDIEAKSGTFSGKINGAEINGATGTIGGFRITGNSLESIANKDGVPFIQLIGADNDSTGKIIAQNIELGVGAQITDYIRLVDNKDEGESAYIFNPLYNGEEVEHAENLFLKAGSVELYSTGRLNVGANGIITSGENGFTITPEVAIFNNIVAAGKISTAVFEQGHIQSVGGIMMFKPAYQVLEVLDETVNETEYKVLVLDGNIGVKNKNQVVQLIGPNGEELGVYQILDIEEEDDRRIYLQKDIGNVIPLSINLIGELGSGLVIGVNSNNTTMSGLYGHGITLSELNTTLAENNSTLYNSVHLRTFLGDLSSLNIPNVIGYGLYSDNVFLKGALTTQVQDNTSITYAGIDTISSTHYIDGEDKDHGAIVFWGGARGNGPTSIQDAKFKVTDEGYLYARDGFFEGSILVRAEITGATINGADIYAARIHGAGSDPAPGLSFYDMTKGITFYNGEYNPQASSQEVFSIGQRGLKVNEEYFAYIDDNNVSLNVSKSAIGNLSLEDSIISNDNLQLDFNITTNKIESKSDFNAKADVYYGEKLRYKRVVVNGVEEGYDLYIGG